MKNLKSLHSPLLATLITSHIFGAQPKQDPLPLSAVSKTATEIAMHALGAPMGSPSSAALTSGTTTHTLPHITPYEFVTEDGNLLNNLGTVIRKYWHQACKDYEDSRLRNYSTYPPPEAPHHIKEDALLYVIEDQLRNELLHHNQTFTKSHSWRVFDAWSLDRQLQATCRAACTQLVKSQIGLHSSQEVGHSLSAPAPLSSPSALHMAQQSSTPIAPSSITSVSTNTVLSETALQAAKSAPAAAVEQAQKPNPPPTLTNRLVTALYHQRTFTAALAATAVYSMWKFCKFLRHTYT
jgi:hypothetical protein